MSKSPEKPTLEIVINVDDDTDDTSVNRTFDEVSFAHGAEKLIDLETADTGQYTRDEKITKPDTWCETTPTIPEHKIKPYIEAVKRSSQNAIRAGALCALEVLALEEIVISPENRLLVEDITADVISKYIKDAADDHSSWLHKNLAELTAELIKVQAEKKAMTKRLVKQRKAILDFARDGDLDKLKEVVYGPPTEQDKFKKG